MLKHVLGAVVLAVLLVSGVATYADAQPATGWIISDDPCNPASATYAVIYVGYPSGLTMYGTITNYGVLPGVVCGHLYQGYILNWSTIQAAFHPYIQTGTYAGPWGSYYMSNRGTPVYLGQMSDGLHYYAHGCAFSSYGYATQIASRNDYMTVEEFIAATNAANNTYNAALDVSGGDVGFASQAAAASYAASGSNVGAYPGDNSPDW